MAEHEFQLAWNRRDPSELKPGSWIKHPEHGRLVQVEAVREVEGGYEVDCAEPRA